MNKETA